MGWWLEGGVEEVTPLSMTRTSPALTQYLITMGQPHTAFQFRRIHCSLQTLLTRRTARFVHMLTSKLFHAHTTAEPPEDRSSSEHFK